MGYGDRVARSWLRKLVSVLPIVVALPVFATLSSNITIQTLRTTIGGLQDLVERRVRVLHGSTSEEYMRGVKAVAFSFDRIEEAYKWLVEGRLEAVVYDRPNLRNYARNEGKGKVVVVGRTFAPQDYCLAIPQGSPLREDLSSVLLNMMENGSLERIRSKWFGAEP